MMQCLSENDIQWVNSILDALDKSDMAAVMSYVSDKAVVAETLPYKFHLMGLSAIRIGNFSEALSLFKQASDAKPNSKIHFEACGFCAAKLGMLSDSLYYMKMSATCEEASSFESTLLPSWMGTVEDQVAAIEERPFLREAQISYAAGQLSKTLEHLQQALNADPFNVESWLLIYRTMLLLDRKYDAIQAVKAANDSGHVSSDILIECAFYAAQLGLSEDVQNLTSLARSGKVAGISSPQEIMVLKPDATINVEYSNQKEKWISSNIPKSNKAEKLPFLEKKVRLGIYSSRLGLNQGLDPIVNFLIEMGSGEMLSWLNIYVYSNAEFMDVNTRRLASSIYEFRSVDEIDPRTLSRIMKNDGLHFLWDLDGFNLGGKPEIHAEISIPFRWVSHGNENAKYKFEDLRKDVSHELSCAPFLIPATFEAAIIKDLPKQSNGNLRISIPYYPNQITNEFLSIFKEFRKKHPEFTLVLDTKRLGGISYVDHVEQLFAKEGLQNFIEFVEPYESASDYQEALYGTADYLMVPEGEDELQISYFGILYNCRQITFMDDTNPNKAENNTGKILSKTNDSEFDKASLLQTFDEEFKENSVLMSRLAEQSHLIAELNSVESRKKRILNFGDLLQKNIEELYGDSVHPMLFSKDASL